MFRILPLAALFALAACRPGGDAVTSAATSPVVSGSGEQAVAQAPADEAATEAPASMPTTMPTDAAPTEARAVPSVATIQSRVAESQARLSTSEAGQRMRAAIDAHGGLERWYTNGPMSFRFAYAPVEGTTRDTRQLVDTWSARAVHEVVSSDARFGWDGETAWVQPPDAELTTNPRFWSLTPYYFVGIPFVLADPGVRLELDGELDVEGRRYVRVRATFGDGVGDAPDDWYSVLIDRETFRVGGVIYVVSYPGFFPDGGTTEPKLMMYDGEQTIDGITLPTSFRTFPWPDEPNGESEPTAEEHLVTRTTLTEVSFAPGTPAAAFDVPEGAQVLEGY